VRKRPSEIYLNLFTVETAIRVLNERGRDEREAILDWCLSTLRRRVDSVDQLNWVILGFFASRILQIFFEFGSLLITNTKNTSSIPLSHACSAAQSPSVA
jgi:hypothetical protein